MKHQPIEDGATALPIARAFLDTGGRFIISPEGKLEAIPNILRIFGSEKHPVDPNESRRGYVIARRLFRRLRNKRFARSVQALVVTDGTPTPNGWLVLEGGAA